MRTLGEKLSEENPSLQISVDFAEEAAVVNMRIIFM